jgi:TetR/AcrR family transcriptional repressor of nem operon
MGADEPGTRERILNAGREVICAKSYNGAGLSEILKAASVPKGSFYHYFSSKEDFGIALIESLTAEHGITMRRLLSRRNLSPVTRLRAYFEEGVAFYREQGPTRKCIVAKMALELSQLSEPMRAAIKCAYDSWALILAQVIREAQALGEIHLDHDPERLASLLINLWEGATIRMQIDRNCEPLVDMLAYVFEGGLLRLAPARRALLSA